MIANKIMRIIRRVIKGDKNIVISKKAHIVKSALLKTVNDGKIVIGEGAFINANVFLCADRGKLNIDKKVTINRNSSIVCRGMISIGEGTSIGPNVIVYDHDHKIDSNGFKKDDFKIGEISIGKNVWIGGNVCILRGSVIGDNCVIGAGTVLKGIIEKNTIVYESREKKQVKISTRGGERC